MDERLMDFALVQNFTAREAKRPGLRIRPFSLKSTYSTRFPPMRLVTSELRPSAQGSAPLSKFRPTCGPTTPKVCPPLTATFHQVKHTNAVSLYGPLLF